MNYDGLSGPFLISSTNGGKSVDPELYAGSKYVSGLGLVIPIETVQKAANTLARWTPVKAADVLANPLPPYRDWKEEGLLPDCILKDGCAAIDAGMALPGIVEKFTGSAPDLGAAEYGVGIQYGPRVVGIAPYECIVPPAGQGNQ